MRDQDEVELERQEAATETPAFLGCPQHMPTKLPGGFDGVEPGEKSKYEVEVEELKKRGAKLKECNDRSYAKMNEIAMIANECIQRTTHAEYAPGQYGQDYRTFGKAMCEIRQLVGPGLAERFAALPPRQKPVDPTAPEVVHPQRLDDIGMQMDKVVIVDDDGVVCKIRRAGVLMLGIGRPAQLWEIDAMKHPTYCRVQVFCDHKPIFDGKAFGKNLHRASALGLAVVIRFVLAQRKHQRNCRAAAAAKKKGGAK